MTAHQPGTFNFNVLWNQIEREALQRYVTAFTRRDFIKLLAAGASGAALVGIGARGVQARMGLAPHSAQIVSTPTLPNGIAAGDLTQTSAVLWARAAWRGTVMFEISETPDFAAITQTLTADATDPLVPVKVEAAGLRAGRRYYYRVTDPSGAALSGRFATPAELGAQTGLRFGVSGDWRGELRPYPALHNTADFDLAFFMAHGDTIYADYPTPEVPAEQARTLEQFRKKHAEIYTERFGINTWAALRAQTAIFATIDDHEVTNDFAGGASVSSDPRFSGDVPYINQTDLYRNGLQAFEEYHPIRHEVYHGTGDDRMEGRPKLYRYVTFGSDAAVIVLDARSFRDEAFPQITDITNSTAIDAFLAQTFTPGRTFLGRTQVDDLKRDLLDAHAKGITWKFVMIPEPIQQMGWFGGSDRWEGYAPERTEVLRFIEDNGIQNVVFISADVHTTFINNLFYQTEAGGTLIETGAWEISTGSVAFSPPTGAALVQGARDFGLITQAFFNDYLTKSIPEQDEILRDLFDRFVLNVQGFDRLGLRRSRIDAELVQGGWVAGHTFGWTLFEIDAETQALTVTTYGIPAYRINDLLYQTDEVLSRQPEIVSQLVVQAR